MSEDLRLHTSANSIPISKTLLRCNSPHCLTVLSYILLLRYELTFKRLRKVLGIKLPMEA